MTDKPPIEVKILGFLNLITAGDATSRELKVFTDDLIKIVEPYYIEKGRQMERERWGKVFGELLERNNGWGIVTKAIVENLMKGEAQ